MKNIIFWVLLIVLTSQSCRSQQNKNGNNTLHQKVENIVVDLGVDELTLIHFPSDTSEVHVELGLSSGDYTMFYFKSISKNLMNPRDKIRGLLVEVKQSENKNSPSVYLDSLKTVNYHSYAFEISKADWDSIKAKANEIELKADTSYKNYYCEFCPHYSLGYNNKMIADKLTKDNKVKALFNYLFRKYSNILYSSKK